LAQTTAIAASGSEPRATNSLQKGLAVRFLFATIGAWQLRGGKKK
jgi:hypothetical protein